MHGGVLRQALIQDGRHEIGRQRGQIEHAAHIVVVDLLANGEFGDRFGFARLKHGQPARAVADISLRGLVLRMTNLINDISPFRLVNCGLKNCQTNIPFRNFSRRLMSVVLVADFVTS